MLVELGQLLPGTRIEALRAGRRLPQSARHVPAGLAFFPPGEPQPHPVGERTVEPGAESGPIVRGAALGIDALPESAEARHLCRAEARSVPSSAPAPTSRGAPRAKGRRRVVREDGAQPARAGDRAGRRRSARESPSPRRRSRVRARGLPAREWTGGNRRVADHTRRAGASRSTWTILGQGRRPENEPCLQQGQVETRSIEGDHRRRPRQERIEGGEQGRLLVEVPHEVLLDDDGVRLDGSRLRRERRTSPSRRPARWSRRRETGGRGHRRVGLPRSARVARAGRARHRPRARGRSGRAGVSADTVRRTRTRAPVRRLQHLAADDALDRLRREAARPRCLRGARITRRRSVTLSKERESGGEDAQQPGGGGLGATPHLVHGTDAGRAASLAGARLQAWPAPGASSSGRTSNSRSARPIPPAWASYR